MSLAVSMPRRRRDHFHRKQSSGSRLRLALHASTVLIQRAYSQATLLAKCRPHQPTRFKFRNQGFHLSTAPPPPHHSRFAHNSSAPLNSATEQHALLRRIRFSGTDTGTKRIVTSHGSHFPLRSAKIIAGSGAPPPEEKPTERNITSHLQAAGGIQAIGRLSH